MFYLTEIISKKVIENLTFQRLKRIRNNFSWIKEIWRQTISVWWLETSGPGALKFLSLSVAGRGTLSGPRSGLLSNAWKWIAWGDTRADKAWDFIGKGHLGKEQQDKGTQTVLPHAHSLRFYGNGVGFQVASGQSSWLRVFLVGARSTQPR